MKKWVVILLMAAAVFSVSGCAENKMEAISRTGEWWKNEVNVTTWPQLTGDRKADEKTLSFLRQCNVRIADRGVYYGHYPEEISNGTALSEYYHSLGMNVISFNSVEHWDPADADAMIASLLRQIDEGCDGIHLDMLFQPADPAAAPAAVRKMRDALKQYAKEQYGKDILFTGNVWKLDSQVGVEIARECDVAWLETNADSDLDVVRMCRTGKATGDKPVWVHWQPDSGEVKKVRESRNLGKALMSSCLMENAVFLCNPFYPVQALFGGWEMIPVSDAWKKEIVKYERFAAKYQAYYLDAKPLAEAAFLIRPGEAKDEAGTINTLIRSNVNFDVVFYDDAKAVDENLLGQYRYIFSTGDLNAATPARQYNLRTSNLQNVIDEVKSRADSFYRIDCEAPVVGRLTAKEGTKLLHLKNAAYDRKTDSIKTSGEINVIMQAKEVKSVTLVSPDRAGKTSLKFSQNGDAITFSVPSVEYYSMVIVE